VGIQVDPSIIDQVADAVSALVEVSWVVVTTGAYDIFAWVEVQSAEDLGIFLRRKLGAISGVRRTETFVNLAIKKPAHGVSI
jgi:Lrp/AsnC family transcriptional regulator for asnA, asnC and gidA